MENDDFLQKLLNYQYKQGPAFLKMNDIKQKLSSNDPFLQVSSNNQRNLGQQQSKTKKKKSLIYENHKFNNQVKEGQDIQSLENKIQQLKLQIKQEDDRYNILDERNQKVMIQILKREFEFEQILNEQNDIRFKNSKLEKDHKLMQNQRSMQNNINEYLNQMKQKFAESIIEKEKKIIAHYTFQIEELRRMFENEFQNQIKKDQEFFKKEIVLIQDIEWLRSIAEKIDGENHKIQDNLKKLQLENFADNSEKKFLIELFKKKNDTRKLKIF